MLRVRTQPDTVLAETQGLSTKEGPGKAKSEDGTTTLNEMGLDRQ